MKRAGRGGGGAVKNGTESGPRSGSEDTVWTNPDTRNHGHADK